MRQILLTKELYNGIQMYLNTKPYGEVQQFIIDLSKSKHTKEGYKIFIKDLQYVADYLADQKFKEVIGLMNGIINATEVAEPTKD